MIGKCYYRECLLAVLVMVVSSCSHKLTPRKTTVDDVTGIPVKRGPYVMVKPEKEIAEKYASLMGVKRGDIQNGRLYSFIEELYGTPYRLGGMDKYGIDCSGLVFLLQLQVYDQPVPRTCAMQVGIIKRKYEDELQEGDLVFFDFDGKQFSHVGVYLQNGYFVHASTRKGVMIARLHDNGIYKFFSRAGSVIDNDTAIQTSMQQ
ncbi:C40 family peptidase [Mucilaginibacter sp.]|uniref:C40 family peptidase n=1 Tax=Mucilaginibacter sp. TaxID=1882438 RepID=UPI0025FA9C60|nr:C40 family peptidase [Mucilaginibacter sp.]